MGMGDLWICAQKSYENSQDSFLSFYHAGPSVWTQGVKLGSKCLYPLQLLTGPFLFKENKKLVLGLSKLCDE